MLLQFAQLGVAYAEKSLSASPSPGICSLLTIGAEPGKGNKLAKRTHELLAADTPHGGLPISFMSKLRRGR